MCIKSFVWGAVVILLMFHEIALSQPFSHKIVLLDSTGADIQNDLIDVEDIVYLNPPSDSQTYLFKFVNNEKWIYAVTDTQAVFHGLIPDLGSIPVGFYDFNNDSLPDLLGGVSVSLNEGNYGYGSLFPAVDGELSGSIHRAGDFNADGTIDVASLEVSFQGSGLVYGLHVYLLDSNKAILHEATVEEEDEILVFQIVDFNNDGFYDIVYFLDVFGSNKIVLLTNMQDNTFSRQQLNFQDTDNFLELSDFDSDMDFDFILTGFNGRDIYMVQNANGILGTNTKIVDTEKLIGLEVGDVNADGHSDIVYLENQDFETFNIWLMLGLGNFQFDTPSSVGSLTGSGINVGSFERAYEGWLALRDYDWDGDLDIFANEIREQKYVVFDNLWQKTATTIVVDELEIELLPNPVNEALSIKSKIPIPSLCIYNSSGQIVYCSEENDIFEMSVPFGSFANGQYFIQFTNVQGKIYTRSIVKQ